MERKSVFHCRTRVIFALCAENKIKKIYGPLASAERLDHIQLFPQTQALHKFSLLYFVHVKPVNFTPVNVGKITRL